VAWKANGCRHSFASYSFALCADAGRVAGYCGNSPAMIHKALQATLHARRRAEIFQHQTGNRRERATNASRRNHQYLNYAPQKKSLTISYCQPADKELKRLTAEAEKLLRATSPPPPETVIKSFTLSLAALALYPEMMRQRGTITENFQCCYARRPDATLQILTRLRQLACERQRKEFTRQQRTTKRKPGMCGSFWRIP